MKKNFIVFILIFILPHFLNGQGEVSLSLSEAVKKAVEHSPNLKKLSLNSQKHSSDLLAFNSINKPQINFETQLGINPVLPTQRIPDFISGDFTKTIPVQFGTLQNHQATLTASQILYSRAIQTGRLALMKSFELNEIQTKKAKEDLTYHVTKLYFQVKSLKYQVNTINNSIEQLEKLYDLGIARQKAGLGLSIDNDKIKLNINNLQAQKEIFASQEQSLADIINVLVNFPNGTKLNFTTSEYESIEFKKHLNTNDLKSTTLDLFDLQKEVVKTQIESTLSSNKPTIAAFGSLGGQMLGDGVGDIFKSDRYSYFLTFGLQIKIPIYNGKQYFHKANSLKTDLLQVDEDKKSYVKGLEQQYLNAYQSYFSNLKQLQTLNESVALAEKIYKLSVERYSQGIAPLIDVIDAQKNLADARNNVDATKLMITLNTIDLNYFTGNIINQ